MGLKELKNGFLNPSEEFSPIPFWFWNDTLTEEELNRQMVEFKEKGVDGFVIHPRLGLPEEIGYLTETYFHYVKFAVKRAEELHMQVILYDEAMYPSGSCHGEVVKENPEFASKGLQMRKSSDLNEGESLVYAMEYDGEAYYFIQGFTEGTIRGVHDGEDDREARAPKSADLLNARAVACFIRLTHERYYEQLKEHFGKTVTAMFTDEPNIMGRCGKKGMIPWTDGFLDDFVEQGADKEDLYLLFVNGDTPQSGQAKNIYQKAVHKRMSLTYYKQIADWCQAHGIGMAGHPENSMDIGYLQYFTIPCQDIVWRFIAPGEGTSVTGEHSTMGKCSADSARHRGKRRNGNECFGCCSTPENPYRLTREEMKWYLDWLFVRGVNLIIPHAFYYSLREQRRDERPPEVGIHSGFWQEYRVYSDYIKRMCYLLTDAVNQTETAVLCDTQRLSWEIAKPLFEHQIEFNYLEKELLQTGGLERGGVRIGNQFYKIIIAEESSDLDWETEAFLKEFEAWGGRVIGYENDDLLLEEWNRHGNTACMCLPADRDLRMTHLKKEGIEFYILTNEGNEVIQTQMHLRDGRITEIWDAFQGTMVTLEKPVQDVPVQLNPCSGILLVDGRS